MATSSFAAHLMLGLLAVALPLCGVLMALTPYLMPKRECFAVTIPASEAGNPYIGRLKRAYCLAVLAATAVLTALSVASLVLSPERAFLPTFAVSVLVLCPGCYALMLYFRAKVQAYKREQGWEASSSKRVGFVAEDGAPAPLSLVWDLLFLPAIVLAAVMAAIAYPTMPDQVPLQMNLSGEISNWAEKTPVLAAFPAVLSAFLAACFAFNHWSIIRSKRGIDAAQPAASAWAYGAFARVQSVMLVGVGAMLTFLGPLMCLTFCGVFSLPQVLPLIVVMIAVALVANLGVTVAYGQNGARLLQKVDASEGMPSDDDRYWKLGVFYWNVGDASLFVPARFSVGWSINWGRPAAWAILVAFVLVTVAFVAFSVTL